MQWNGVRPNPDRPAPLRSLMEILQQKAEPYVTQYGENQIPGAGQLLNSIMRTGTEMVPGVGDLLGAEDLQTAAQNNDWAGIGLGALAAIPGIPAFGRGVRGEARAARGVANTVADAVPTNQPMTEAEAALARYRAANPNDTGARVLSPGDQGYPTNAQWDEASQTYVEPVAPDYPIRAYHGSPHSFDRFSLDKIGTGEGAQAYGHGLYFAESEDVARQYRDTLAGDGYLRPDGSVWNPQTLQHMNVRVAANRNGADLEATIARAREVLQRAVESSPPETVAMARADLAELEALRDAGGVRPNPGSMYEVGINADPNTFLDWDRPLSEQSEAVRRALALDALPQKPDFDLDAMLALSAERSVPVHELPEYRAGEQLMDTADQRAWQTLGIDAPHWGGRPEDLPGQDFYRALGTGGVGPRILDSAPQGNVGAAQYLQERGIPGIRYLDASSRYNPAALPDNPISNEARQWLDIAQGDSAEALRQFNASNPIERFAGPERDEVRKVIEAAARRPTSNYVVFNDELVKILRKYGISGLSTTVGASALAEELDRRGQTQEF